MRKGAIWLLAAVVAAVITGYPWILAWAFIRDPAPAEVARMAESLLAGARFPVAAVDAGGAARRVTAADIARLSPGPCLRDHETEAFGRYAYAVRVTHWCRIDLTLHDGGTASAGLVRQQWVGDPPAGLHEHPLPAEAHDLDAMLPRLPRR